MSELTGIYAVWLREFKVFLREKSRVIASIFTPLLWIFVFGSGLGASVSLSGMNYQIFIFPGIIAMSVLFTSVFFGIYIIWDRKFDFLKEVMVAPLARPTIFFGKVLGGTTDALLQSFILLLVGPAIGIKYGLSVIAAIPFVVLLAVGLVSVGLTLGSFIESLSGFQLIGSFLIFPLFFLSGALFPIGGLPSWLAPLTLANPMTYAVDGLRGAILGASAFPMAYDFSVLLVFTLIMMGVGTLAFRRMKI